MHNVNFYFTRNMNVVQVKTGELIPAVFDPPLPLVKEKYKTTLGCINFLNIQEFSLPPEIWGIVNSSNRSKFAVGSGETKLQGGRQT